MAACLDGRPMETTMGMTPLGGFMMGTRTGDMDPGVPLHLVREHGYDDKALEPSFRQGERSERGVRGDCGHEGPGRAPLAGSRGPAAQAIEMYCYQARRTIGSLAAVLGGLDLLVFTGGIGEKAAPVRALICEGLGFLGIELDAAANEVHAETVSTHTGSCMVKVVPTNEDVMITRHASSLVFGGAANAGADPSEGGRS